MVTYCVTKMIPPCSPVIGQFFDTMIVASTYKEWHKGTIKIFALDSAGNCFEPPLFSFFQEIEFFVTSPYFGVPYPLKHKNQAITLMEYDCRPVCSEIESLILSDS